jgi:hypothetical protein
MSDKDHFRKLSVALTGVNDLDPNITREYEARILEAFPREGKEFMDAFDPVAGSADLNAAVLKLLNEHPGPVVTMVRQIVQLWYTSQFTRADGSIDGPQSEAQYKASLLWRVIGAVTPGYSDREYGYWKDKPTALA